MVCRRSRRSLGFDPKPNAAIIASRSPSGRVRTLHNRRRVIYFGIRSPAALGSFTSSPGRGAIRLMLTVLVSPSSSDLIRARAQAWPQTQIDRVARSRRKKKCARSSRHRHACPLMNEPLHRRSLRVHTLPARGIWGFDRMIRRSDRRAAAQTLEKTAT